LGLALSLARALAKLAVPLALGRPSGLSWKQSAALGLALNPVAGVSFVLLLDLAHQVAGFPQALIAGAFAAIAVLELGGTLLARWALGRAGDIPSKRKNP
jgi:Kef-type K+ transport system membrane component KefB